MRIYIASGDFLTRNTERRVEVGVRVDDPTIAKKLRGILDLQLRDTVNAREMQPDGTYTKVKPAPGQPPGGQPDGHVRLFSQNGFEQATEKSAPAVKPVAKRAAAAAQPAVRCPQGRRPAPGQNRPFAKSLWP